MTARGQGGIAGLALIVGVFIAAILFVLYFRTQSPTGEGKTSVTAIDATRAVACRTNRQNVERDIQMWLVNHPGEAPSFAALEADGVRIPSCPEAGTYSIDGVQVLCDKHD